MTEAIAIRPQPGPQEMFLSSPADIVVYGGAAGGGKMLPLGTPLPTPSGWTTIGSVRPGDAVFDERGQPCTVLAVHEIEQAPEAYRVVFSDGVEQVACASHQWLTFDARELSALTRKNDEWRAARRAARPSRAAGNKSEAFAAAIGARNSQRAASTRTQEPAGSVRTTAEIAATLRTKSGRANHAIQMTKPLALPRADLPLDPYVLGVWLGDGTTCTGVVTSADEGVIEAVRMAGFEVLRVPSAKYGWRVVGLSAVLRQMGLIGRKFVPAAYLRASAEQRQALLQGLMDTDGHATKSGACEFMTTNEALRDGFSELLATLGIKSTWANERATLYGRDCGPRYRFKFSTSVPAFRLARKAAAQNLDTRRTTRMRYIVACEPCPTMPMRCISVSSPSHLYLAGAAMVPTHNSWGLLMEPLRHVTTNHQFAAVFFRRNTTQIRNPGGLWDESRSLYPLVGARPAKAVLEWRWPGGGLVKFAHLEHESTVYDWQGAQIPLICFDELTHFSKGQFFYMLSRNRSTCGVRPYIRATTNPDADSWVRDFIGWWIDQDTGLAIPERSGVIRWFLRINDAILWADTAEELIQRHGRGDLPADHEDQPRPKSVTFIAAKLTDNRILLAKDPGYKANLDAQNAVERARLLGGNWKVRPAAGMYFRREWCRVVDAAPEDIDVVRYWDLAATEKTAENDPDWTVGVKMGRSRSTRRFIVLDARRMQVGPGKVREAIINTAAADGQAVAIRLPQDPGQAGKDQAAEYVAALAMYDARARRETGDKVTRFGAFSAQCEAGNVDFLRGAWNAEVFDALEAFPEARHDDDADACSGAYSSLASTMGDIDSAGSGQTRVLGGQQQAAHQADEVHEWMHQPAESMAGFV